MDEKTRELRDIFLDVAEEETVTERQEESPGSLADERSPEERLEPVIERMRESYEFETDGPLADYCQVVRGFFEGESDRTLATVLDRSSEEVFRMRMDLHLVDESDVDVPFDRQTFRDRLEDRSIDEIAAEFDVDETSLRRAERALRAREQARTANERYRDEFEEIVADGDLAGRLRDAREDGLEDATEGMENDLSM